ncbi:MAG: hypothetical protein HY840_09665 [Bacteroidetes bacterium]|nr:hypothetical protein [Bacteroidota bacterium]
MAITFLGQISEKLQAFSVSKNYLKGKDEPAISKMVFQHLKDHGLKVTNEKQIGFLKFYIDIDYNDGSAGVEVKLADKLIKDTGEIQRLLGQTYYYTNHYKDVVNVVMILVIGEKNLELDPKIKEIKKHIENIGATFLYFPTKD